MSRPRLLSTGIPLPTCVCDSQFRPVCSRNKRDVYIFRSTRSFSGTLDGEEFQSWVHRWLAWLRLHGVSEADAERRTDLLALAMDSGSVAQRQFYRTPDECRQSWQLTVAWLQSKFADPNRVVMVSCPFPPNRLKACKADTCLATPIGEGSCTQYAHGQSLSR